MSPPIHYPYYVIYGYTIPIYLLFNIIYYSFMVHSFHEADGTVNLQFSFLRFSSVFHFSSLLPLYFKFIIILFHLYCDSYLVSPLPSWLKWIIVLHKEGLVAFVYQFIFTIRFYQPNQLLFSFASRVTNGVTSKP